MTFHQGEELGIVSHVDDIRTSTEPNVRECTDSGAWQQHVLEYDQSLFHRWEWNRVYAAYGLEVLRLAAYRGSRITGVLPMVRQAGRLFGDQTVSLPWFDCVGALSDCDTTRLSLIDAASSRVTPVADAVLQIRQRESLTIAAHCRRDKVLMRLHLPSSNDELWTKLKAKVRNQIRKAEKSGLEATIGRAELIGDFFRVYVRRMRDLGSPSHSYRFFQAVAEAFPHELRVIVTRVNGKTVGGGIVLRNGTAIEVPWASSLAGFNKYCVNHLMYWRLLCHAIDSRCTWFHFGRSSVGSGTYRFKKQWGAEPLQLYWYYIAGDSARAEAAAQSATEGHGTAKRIWNWLPLSVTKRVGPRLISQLP